MTQTNTGRQYQNLVELTVKHYSKSFPECIIQTNVFVVDPDGIRREIDILVTTGTGILHSKIAIECKDYSRRVGIHQVEAFNDKLRDISVNSGILISRRGFTNGARKKAARIGIKLATIGDIEALDFSPIIFFSITHISRAKIGRIVDISKLLSNEKPVHALLSFGIFHEKTYINDTSIDELVLYCHHLSTHLEGMPDSRETRIIGHRELKEFFSTEKIRLDTQNDTLNRLNIVDEFKSFENLVISYYSHDRLMVGNMANTDHTIVKSDDQETNIFMEILSFNKLVDSLVDVEEEEDMINVDYERVNIIPFVDPTSPHKDGIFSDYFQVEECIDKFGIYNFDLKPLNEPQLP